MTALRAFIRDHRQLAAALLALALCLKAALPAGFMLTPSAASTVTISICADSSGGMQAMQVVIPAKHAGQGETAPKHPACAFTSLADSALGGADALLLALAFAFILILGLAPMRRSPFAQVLHLRPPLRGPPKTA
jgi:hypothetical protein